DDVLHAGEALVAIRVRHELGEFVGPDALLVVRRDGDGAGRRAGDAGQLVLHRGQVARLVVRGAVGDDDDEVLLAGIGDRADISLRRAAVGRQRAGRDRAVGVRDPAGGKIDRAARIRLGLAVARIRGDAGEIV